MDILTDVDVNSSFTNVSEYKYQLMLTDGSARRCLPASRPLDHRAVHRSVECYQHATRRLTLTALATHVHRRRHTDDGSLFVTIDDG